MNIVRILGIFSGVDHAGIVHHGQLPLSVGVDVGVVRFPTVARNVCFNVYRLCGADLVEQRHCGAEEVKNIAEQI